MALFAVVVGMLAFGQATGGEGRKRFATSALFTADGRQIAVAEATWITLSQP